MTRTNWLSPFKLCGTGCGDTLEQNQSSVNKEEWRVANWVGSQQSSPQHLKKFFSDGTKNNPLYKTFEK